MAPKNEIRAPENPLPQNGAPAPDAAFPYRSDDGHVRDGLIDDDAPVVRLSRFEGPLDLLLFLVRKSELDIYDIPIESVTRQYLEILHKNEQLDLDIAGEFFVMASTLMYIKSRVLLPAGTSGVAEDKTLAGDDDGNGSDPRCELIRQLVEYKRLKDSSQHIAELAERRRRFPDRIVVPAEDAPQRPLVPVGKMELWSAFNVVLRRLADRIVPGEIQGDAVTIAQRMEEILERARTEKSFTFSSLLPEKMSVSVLVSTFLACLELARLGRLGVRQDDLFGEIYCDVNDAPDAPAGTGKNVATATGNAENDAPESEKNE